MKLLNQGLYPSPLLRYHPWASPITGSQKTPGANAHYISSLDEVNALNEELNTKKRLVDSVSKEKAQVISILKDKVNKNTRVVHSVVHKSPMDASIWTTHLSH